MLRDAPCIKPAGARVRCPRNVAAVRAGRHRCLRISLTLNVVGDHVREMLDALFDKTRGEAR